MLSLKLNKKQGNIEEEKAKAIKATRMRKITQEAPAYTLGSVFAGLVPKNNLMNFIVMWGVKSWNWVVYTPKSDTQDSY